MSAPPGRGLQLCSKDIPVQIADIWLTALIDFVATAVLIYFRLRHQPGFMQRLHFIAATIMGKAFSGILISARSTVRLIAMMLLLRASAYLSAMLQRQYVLK